jgi:hypothetical protein
MNDSTSYGDLHKNHRFVLLKVLATKYRRRRRYEEKPSCNALHQLGYGGGDIRQLDDVPLRGLNHGRQHMLFSKYFARGFLVYVSGRKRVVMTPCLGQLSKCSQLIGYPLLWF